MWSPSRQQCVLVAAAALIFFVNLGAARLWDDDEPKNAQCAREMFNRGDWIVPTFNGDLRCDKPILIYWLMMSAYQVFGDNEFAARLWSAVAAIGTTLATYHLGRLLFNARTAFWSGWMMASSLMFVIAGRAATPDSLMIFFSTLAMLAFVQATWGRNATLAGANRLADYLPRTWLGYVAMYAAMGVGVLAKGPVVVVLPTLVLVIYVACVRQALAAPASAPAARRYLRYLSPVAWLVAAWRLRPITALFVVGAIAVPWYVVVGLQTDGRWLAGFFGQHNVGRYLSPMEGHRGPFWFYVPAVLFGFFPWSTFLPQAVVRTAKLVRQSPSWAAYLFLACWAGTWIGFFSFSGTKLPSYVTPAYPALAVMTAAWIDAWLAQPSSVSRWFLRQSIVSLGLAGALLAIVLPIVAHYLLPGEEVIGLAGLTLLAGIVPAAFWAVSKPQRAAVALAVAALAFMVSAFGFAAVRASRHQNSAALVDVLRSGDSGYEPAAFDFSTPSLVYYAHQRVPQFMLADDALKHLQSSPRALVVTDSRRYEELRSRLPGDVAIVARRPRFLRTGAIDVVVLGHAGMTAQRTTVKPY
ncbi:MAG TPA: glycosyltransferase family 39 protein [Pirellulales bacterium]|nr:glycosyltransferase family 39 protein [Pirellulales bacterium]